MRTRSFAFDAAALALLAALALIVLVLTGHVRAEPLTTYRDNMGRVQGYATTHGNTTTYQDAQGRQTGRAERRPDGTVQFYDVMGRSVGTAVRSFKWQTNQ
jgi:hypothetical protein